MTKLESNKDGRKWDGRWKIIIIDGKDDDWDFAGRKEDVEM